MADRKSNSAVTKQLRSLTVLSEPSDSRALAAQLQREIDKLAIMLEEVKKQSDRVQAMADSIGDQLLQGSYLDAVAARAHKREGTPRSPKVVEISALS
jgi:hypothetical protein